VSAGGNRAAWDERHRGRAAGAPEPFLVEMLPLIPPGIALDVAAGRGRNSLALARAGIEVIAVDSSEEAVGALQSAARAEGLPIHAVLADLREFPLRENALGAIVNINFLDRTLFPSFARALKPGGVLLVDTFLVDQAEIGHPRNPEYLLRHYELRDLVAGLELLRYREGLTVYADETRAWRASAVARRRETNGG
jgi:tellurite methyltransferase